MQFYVFLFFLSKKTKSSIAVKETVPQIKRLTQFGNDGQFVFSRTSFPAEHQHLPSPPPHLVGVSPPPSCCRSLGVGAGPPDCVRAKSEGAIWRLEDSERTEFEGNSYFEEAKGRGGLHFLTAIYLEQMISFRRMDYNIESITKRGF